MWFRALRGYWVRRDVAFVFIVFIGFICLHGVYWASPAEALKELPSGRVSDGLEFRIWAGLLIFKKSCCVLHSVSSECFACTCAEPKVTL